MKTKICTGIIRDKLQYVENPNVIYIKSCFLNSKMLMNVSHIIYSSYVENNPNNSLILHLSDSDDQNNGGYSNNLYINNRNDIKDVLQNMLTTQQEDSKYCIVFNILSIFDAIIVENMDVIKQIAEKWQKTDNLLIFNEMQSIQDDNKGNEFFNNCFLINEHDIVGKTYYYDNCHNSVVVDNITAMFFLMNFRRMPVYQNNKIILSFLCNMKKYYNDDKKMMAFSDSIITQQFLYEKSTINNIYTEMFYDFFILYELPYYNIKELTKSVDNAKITFLKMKDSIT